MALPQASRPTSVSIVVVLTWISAILTILTGILLLFVSPAGDEVEGPGGSGAIVIIGVVTLIIGVITAAVASRLGKGGNGARLLVSALEILQIAGALAAMATHGAGSTIGSSVITIIIALAILGLLWNKQANAFFAAN